MIGRERKDTAVPRRGQVLAAVAIMLALVTAPACTLRTSRIAGPSVPDEAEEEFQSQKALRASSETGDSKRSGPGGEWEPDFPPFAPELMAGTPERLVEDLREDPVTESPLDDLATVTPELTPAELEAERDLAAAAAPVYDLPIELNETVLAWVDRYSETLRPFFEQGLARSERYMHLFRPVFDEYDVPQDLIYMASVESGFKTSAYSRAHARGIFQFISATAKRYGLRVDYWVDERSDPEQSARAAAAYMRDLYDEFGDWYLALAAYNAGEGTVRRAIRRTGSRDFWELARTHHLRRETKNHVPAVLAAIVLAKEPGKYGLEYEPEPRLRYDTIEVEGGADLRVLAECSGMAVSQLKAMNPALRRYQTPPNGSTKVRVPVGKGGQTLAALERVPVEERVLYARHRVSRGDTLSDIARAYGVTVSALQSANDMGRRTLIRERQILRIPTVAAGRYGDLPEPSGRGEVLVYRVRKGDTLYGIARRYQTTPSAIAAASDIHTSKLLQVGEHLTVVRGVTSADVARGYVYGSGDQVARDGSGKHTHTVRRGDTLWRIARQYDTSVDRLCALNRITPKTVIRPGWKLTVRN